MGGRWLVDGNNVMGSRPDGWWRDRVGAAARLAAELARWSATTGHRAVVVFDGRHHDPVVRAGNGVIEVRFAGSGRPNAADDVLAAEAGPGDTVVTADRALIARLDAGVDVVGPTTLLAALTSGQSDPTLGDGLGR